MKKARMENRDNIEKDGDHDIITVMPTKVIPLDAGHLVEPQEGYGTFFPLWRW
jgi:hypothetical protein